jgi:CDP-glucose 4,6-dehydratase
VLVTGHTGFKGSWLSAWLLELGAEPFGYALAPETDPSMFERIDLAGRMDHRLGDVRDVPGLERRVDETDPGIIVHMAAQALVRESYRDPLATFGTNVMGTANLLEVVRRRGRPCTVVVVTSDKCYEVGPGDVAFTEGDPLGGHDPYSGSKGAAEIVVSSYRRSFFPPERFEEHGVALASVRAGNVIGGGDWAADRIVPDIVRAVAAGERPGLRNPSAVRPWQHVLDALSGYLWLTALLVTEGASGLAEPWNFGPVDREAVTVEQLTEQVLKLWDHPGWHDAAERGAPPEVGYLRLDCGKAAERLGWRPVWDVERAIESTVAWYRAHLAEKEMRIVTAEQIASYVEAARGAGTIWARPAGETAT